MHRLENARAEGNIFPETLSSLEQVLALPCMRTGDELTKIAGYPLIRGLPDFRHFGPSHATELAQASDQSEREPRAIYFSRRDHHWKRYWPCPAWVARRYLRNVGTYTMHMADLAIESYSRRHDVGRIGKLLVSTLVRDLNDLQMQI